MTKRLVVRSLLIAVLAAGGLSQSAFAQDKCDCWKNSKTGEAVPSYPYHAERPIGDPNRTFVPTTGENYHRVVPCPPPPRVAEKPKEKLSVCLWNRSL